MARDVMILMLAYTAALVKAKIYQFSSTFSKSISKDSPFNYFDSFEMCMFTHPPGQMFPRPPAPDCLDLLGLSIAAIGDGFVYPDKNCVSEKVAILYLTQIKDK